MKALLFARKEPSEGWDFDGSPANRRALLLVRSLLPSVAAPGARRSGGALGPIDHLAAAPRSLPFSGRLASQRVAARHTAST